MYIYAYTVVHTYTQCTSERVTRREATQARVSTHRKRKDHRAAGYIRSYIHRDSHARLPGVSECVPCRACVLLARCPGATGRAALLAEPHCRRPAGPVPRPSPPAPPTTQGLRKRVTAWYSPLPLSQCIRLYARATQGIRKRVTAWHRALSLSLCIGLHARAPQGIRKRVTAWH